MTPFELLHHLWTKAVDAPNYDKDEWRELELMISRQDAVVESARMIRRVFHQEIDRRLSDSQFDALDAIDVALSKVEVSP